MRESKPQRQETHSQEVTEHNRIKRMKDPRFDYMPMAAGEYSAQRQMTVGDLLLGSSGMSLHIAGRMETKA